LVETRAELRRQSSRQGESPLDPERFMSQEFGRRVQAELVLGDQRGDDPCLVHGAGGLRGSVGFEKSCFHRHSRHRLDDDRNLLAAFPSPGGEALEAVQHFVRAVVELRDAKGSRRKRALAVRAFPPKGRQRRTYLLEGHAHHGVASGFTGPF
jgi:hypothetical protein